MSILNNKVIVILGPTASGKSDLAIQIAKKNNGEIISADSRQIYRGMDIGTGKIRGTWNVKRGAYISKSIAHYLINIANPTADYNVAEFKKDAENIIRDILQRGKLPIICGGTGFWISAIVDNQIFPEVKPNRKLRNKLRNYGAEKLFAMLKKLDSERAKNIDRLNKVRLIRAIEICKAIGKVPRPNYDLRFKNYEFLQIGIDINKEKLHRNIKTRLEKRFKQGLIKEVENLRKKYKLSWKKIQSFGLAYYWIPFYSKNKLFKEELFERIYQAEKDYAKRQITWFKKDKRIRWIKNKKEAEKEIRIFFG